MFRRLLFLLFLLPGLLQAETISESKPAPGTWTFNASHPLAQDMVAGYIAECGGSGGADENIVTGSPVGDAAMVNGLTCVAEDAVHQSVLYCDGANDYAAVPDHPLLDGEGTSALSLYILTKPDLTTNSSTAYVLNKDGSGDRSYYIVRKTNQNLAPDFYDATQVRARTEISDGFLNTVWTSMLATIDVSGAGDGSDLHQIEDGQPRIDDAGSPVITTLAVTPHDLVFCGRSGSNTLLGKISTVYVWNRKLTGAELSTLHTDPWAMLTAIGGGPSPQILRRRRQ